MTLDSTNTDLEWTFVNEVDVMSPAEPMTHDLQENKIKTGKKHSNQQG
jgi:hypothetical protein